MENPDGDPYSYLLSFLLLDSFPLTQLAELGVLLLLFVASALMSGSEAAFFSFTQRELLELSASPTSGHRLIARLHERPRILLATILIGNTLANLAIVILSTMLMNEWLAGWEVYPYVKFLVQVITVVFLLVLFSEVIPKTYATHSHLKFATFMVYPVYVLRQVLSPFAVVLAGTGSIMDRRTPRGLNEVSMDELKEAIEMTSSEGNSEEENKILRGIIQIGNTYVKQIMRQRLDVVAHDIRTSFAELVKQIDANRYSRLPIYEGSFDNIKGILYIKDLIPYLDEGPDVGWQHLIRPAYFVPDTKKIDTLLQEFKVKKVHLAIVVDEYGRNLGIVTMEDVLEEIVGDINDESDDEEIFFSQLGENTYIFEGRTALNDVVRIMNIAEDTFEEVRGEAETIGGLVVELAGRVPKAKEELQLGPFTLGVESADKRRVRRVRLTIFKSSSEDTNSISTDLA